jgi:hypothetical protein
LIHDCGGSVRELGLLEGLEGLEEGIGLRRVL